MNIIEEKVEDKVKQTLKDLGLRFYAKSESINSEIDKALKLFPSKSGGDGGNYPDIKLLIDDIPVMIEIKGDTDFIRKCKFTNNGLELDMSKYAIQKYATNGAIHYGLAILTHTHYDKCIAIGIGGNMFNDLFPWSYLIERSKPIKILEDVTNKHDLSYLKDLKNYLLNIK